MLLCLPLAFLGDTISFLPFTHHTRSPLFHTVQAQQCAALVILSDDKNGSTKEAREQCEGVLKKGRGQFFQSCNLVSLLYCQSFAMVDTSLAFIQQALREAIS